MIGNDENAIAIFNEIMVSVYLFVSITLTGFQGPNPKETECGMAAVAIILINFAANLIKFLVVAIMKTVKIMRMRKLKTVPVKPSESVTQTDDRPATEMHVRDEDRVYPFQPPLEGNIGSGQDWHIFGRSAINY